jgi:hypothetical protein
MPEVFEAASAPLVSPRHGKMAKRSWNASLQSFANRRQAELFPESLFEYPYACEHPHHAIKRARISARLSGQFLHWRRLRSHVIRHP